MDYLEYPQGGDPSKRAKQVIDRLRNKGVQLKISETSAGELARVVVRDKNDEAILCNLFHRAKENQEFAICGVHEKDLLRFLQVVAEVRDSDYVIEPTDVLIAAQSIADEGCLGLLTSDIDVISSAGLRNVSSKHRKDFVITAKPS